MSQDDPLHAEGRLWVLLGWRGGALQKAKEIDHEGLSKNATWLFRKIYKNNIIWIKFGKDPKRILGQQPATEEWRGRRTEKILQSGSEFDRNFLNALFPFPVIFVQCWRLTYCVAKFAEKGVCHQQEWTKKEDVRVFSECAILLKVSLNCVSLRERERQRREMQEERAIEEATSEVNEAKKARAKQKVKDSKQQG